MSGRAWDADVRQYYYRYRWYDPHQCRWTAVELRAGMYWLFDRLYSADCVAARRRHFFRSFVERRRSAA